MPSHLSPGLDCHLLLVDSIMICTSPFSLHVEVTCTRVLYRIDFRVTQCKLRVNHSVLLHLFRKA